MCNAILSCDNIEMQFLDDGREINQYANNSFYIYIYMFHPKIAYNRISFFSKNNLDFNFWILKQIIYHSQKNLIINYYNNKFNHSKYPKKKSTYIYIESYHFDYYMSNFNEKYDKS